MHSVEGRLGLGFFVGRLGQAWSRVHHAIPTDSVPTDAIPTIHSRDVDVGWLTAVK